MRWVEPDWLHDAELLGRVGRHGLAAILDLLAPVLAQQGVGLPDPCLADPLYFAELAALFRSQPIKLAVYLAPFFAENSPSRAPKPSAACAGRLQPSDPPRYALRRDGDLWHLTLDGRQAVLNREQGICYVAEMLSQPGERVKKLNLAAKYSSPKSKARGGLEVYDPLTGKCDTPASTGPVHELSLATDENEARRACKARVRELLETIDDPTETARAKEEAREEMEQIAAHLSQDNRPFRDPTKGAGDSVRKAILRFLQNLVEAGGSDAGSQAVRREFAEHLEFYLMRPSGRYASPRARKARGDLTGCLLYEPPPGVVWVVRQ